METVTNKKDLKRLKNNKILGVFPNLDNSKITFSGKNNILFCEEHVNLKNSIINFNADNSLVYLSSNKHIYIVDIFINHNSTCYFGKDNYINQIVHIILSEEKNVIIGNECLFSLNVWLRVSDPHLIYNISDRKRINFSKSIYIGDHVWIGQNVMILKGSQLGSGSILAANGVVAGKRIPSNTSWGGNPLKELKKDIFWEGSCVHRWTSDDTNKRISFESDMYIFENDKHNISFNDIEKELANLINSSDRLEYLKQTLIDSNKNRFFINEKKS